MCVYLQVEDTDTVEHCPNADTTMEDAPLGSGMAESEDATKCILWNASLGGCNDALQSNAFIL